MGIAYYIIYITMNTQRFIRQSVTVRMVLIGLLGLILLIPVGMVRSMIQEREYNRASAVAEISQKWGGQQTIVGPVLTIPYTTYSTDEKGVRTSYVAYAHFLPETLSVEGVIDPEVRSRGIFDAVVYSSDITLSGVFAHTDLDALGVPASSVIWKDAFVSLGIPDMRGIEKEVALTWDEEEFSFLPGIPTSDVIRNVGHTSYATYSNDPYELQMKEVSTAKEGSSGVSAKLPLLGASSRGEHAFSISLSLAGSEQIQFVPLGKTTEVSLASAWQTPSFDGAFLPDDREVTGDGFSATWNVLDLNRNYPQSWVGAKYDVYDSAFGLNLLVPVDAYQKSMRSAKYALLIIALTFLTFFSVEMFNKKRIHPIQYLFVGLTLVLFYSLLVSIAEVLGFDSAYAISSIVTIGVIMMYSLAILPQKRLAYIQTAVLVFAYLFVYMILQLEDYALLAGSVGLFVILAGIMYLSRKVDWYKLGE
jgi:inner membrane protein